MTQLFVWIEVKGAGIFIESSAHIMILRELCHTVKTLLNEHQKNHKAFRKRVQSQLSKNESGRLRILSKLKERKNNGEREGGSKIRREKERHIVASKMII